MPIPLTRRIDTGELAMSMLEWPGQGDPVLLLHATGFHGGCWREVARGLPGCHLLAPDLRYHGRTGALGEPDWGVIADDVFRLVEALDLRRVIAAGHSLGGYALARAAARAPKRFQRLILIDPVIMSPQRYREFQQAHATLTPADHPVSRRKNRWRDADEMFTRFHQRPPFNLWQPQVLRDYCEGALGPADALGFKSLACNPLHEAAIYLNQRGNEQVFEDIAHLHVPVTLLRAAPNPDDPRDLTRSPTWPGLAAALRDCREIYLPDHSHFIPMQDPALVVNTLLAGQ
ncbi:MAG: alpha/beta hydrolase [Halioglobus sp.]|nr:alpha/beta hydrolase [Halioglobus sp.]